MIKNIIKNLREEKGISQEELARIIQISNKQMYNIEKGQNTTITVAKKIKKALGKKTIDEIWID